MRPGDYNNRHQGPQSFWGNLTALALTLAAVTVVVLSAAGVQL